MIAAGVIYLFQSAILFFLVDEPWHVALFWPLAAVLRVIRERPR